MAHGRGFSRVSSRSSTTRMERLPRTVCRCIWLSPFGRSIGHLRAVLGWDRRRGAGGGRRESGEEVGQAVRLLEAEEACFREDWIPIASVRVVWLLFMTMNKSSRQSKAALLEIRTPKSCELPLPPSFLPPNSALTFLFLFRPMSLEDRVASLEDVVKKQSALIESQASFIRRLAQENLRNSQLHSTTFDSHSRLLSFFSRSLFPSGHWIEGVGKAWEWSLVRFLCSLQCFPLISSTIEAHHPFPSSPFFSFLSSSSLSTRRSTDLTSLLKSTLDLLPPSSAYPSSCSTRSSSHWTSPPSSPSASPRSVSSPSLPSSSTERSPFHPRWQIASSASE